MMPARMFTNTVFSPWLVLPVVGALMLVVAAHIGSLQESDQPPSRVRIRVANGWVILLLLPLLGAGFGVINHAARPSLFFLTWLLVIGLLMVCVLLAIADVLNTLRLAQAARREALRESAARLAQELRSARNNAPEDRGA